MCPNGSRSRHEHKGAALNRFAARILEWRFARYVGASASAAAIDLGSFLLLYSWQVAAGFAAVIGYALGTLTHWLISSRAVFADRLADPGLRRGGQQIMFVLSALLGLGLTAAIVAGADAAGYDPRWAKIAAMAASFLSVWLVRLTVVFRASREGQSQGTDQAT